MDNQANTPFLSDDLLLRILSETHRVAVVGISDKPERASHRIARFLLEKQVEVLPVNPRLETVLGMTVYPDLRSVPGVLDVVDIFRRSEAVPPIVDEAIAVSAKVVWMQEGVVHEEAAAKAEAAGLDVVMDRCILKEWQRLLST
ncbi:MAG: CoA-binding protein [bacterium]